MNRPYIYVTRWQTSENFEGKRRSWFKRKRALELIGVGFLSVRAYEADRFPQGCNIYEFDDFSIFDSNEYQRLRTDDKFVSEILSDFTYNSKTLYAQLLILDRRGEEVDGTLPLSGRSLSLLYFHAENEAQVLKWFREHAISAQEKAVRGFRLWKQVCQHPQPTQNEAPWCAVVEWEDAPMDNGLLSVDERQSLEGFKLDRSDLVRKWYGLALEKC